MSQLQNKNVRKLKNIIHIAVHFPMGTSKVCITIISSIVIINIINIIIIITSKHNKIKCEMMCVKGVNSPLFKST